ncbi:non-hydrolyzing UDP-N-acetylglucosamine 2-epimerase [Methanolobus sp. WCC5]|uniref:non-hydrolyzing UDP-N-acetylglucosamine 2-epimerase n=1 Tax=Methanolobus sp. WCC5 TaxID=3125785 RepID=UPI0032452A63
MKVITIVGTRPELIRLSETIKKLDRYMEHLLVHTGQNFDYELNEVFFEELSIRKPDYFMNSKAETLFKQISTILEKTEEILLKEKPDAVLILGDTNSGLSAIVAKRSGIPVFHMEAGNRCYSDKVPEEVNRRIIDSCSDILLPYTQRSKEQLLLEGYHPRKIFVTGNPIAEIIRKFIGKTDNSKVLDNLCIEKDEKYVLVTMHREENVDDPELLAGICETLSYIAKKYKVVVSTHPRTRKRLEHIKIDLDENLMFMKPFGFIDFLKLEMNAFCIITDSGTVQEEATILSVPCILMRTSTERPELLDCGGVFMAGVNKEEILDSFNVISNMDVHNLRGPYDYQDDVSDKIIKILLRYKSV